MKFKLKKNLFKKKKLIEMPHLLPLTTIEDRLRNENFDHLEKFSFNKKQILCRVVDIYDGDTCTIVFYWKDEFVKFKLRLFGIDCCEIKPKKADFETEELRNEHIQKALLAKKFLEEQILNEVVLVIFHEGEMYGRLLGEIYKDGIYINNLMIEKGHAVKYVL